MLANQPTDENAEVLADILSDDLRRDLLQEAEQIASKRMRNDQNWQAYQLSKEGKSAKEIGAQLGMNVTAVYKAKSRVLQFMRNAVSELLKSKGLADDKC